MTGKLIRLSVNLNRETAAALRYLADSQGFSITETVRQAISLYKFVKDEMDAGRRIQSVDTDGSVRELVLR